MRLKSYQVKWWKYIHGEADQRTTWHSKNNKIQDFADWAIIYEENDALMKYIAILLNSSVY